MLNRRPSGMFPFSGANNGTYFSQQQQQQQPQPVQPQPTTPINTAEVGGMAPRMSNMGPTQATVHEHAALIPNPTVPLHLRNLVPPPVVVDPLQISDRVDDLLISERVTMGTATPAAAAAAAMVNANKKSHGGGGGGTDEVSTLHCDSVKANPIWHPAQDVPFVPPLEITIPVVIPPSTNHPQQKQQQQEKKQTSLHSPHALTRTKDLVRQNSCSSRLEFQQSTAPSTSTNNLYAPQSMSKRSSSALLRSRVLSRTRSDAIAATRNPIDHRGTMLASEDDEDHLSYYTSPTDLYMSDESSQQINLASGTVRTPNKKSKMKREFKKLMTRMDALRRGSKQSKVLQPQHAVESIKDYDSFGSSRGLLL